MKTATPNDLRLAALALVAAVATENAALCVAAADHATDLDCSASAACLALSMAQWLTWVKPATPESEIESAWKSLRGAADTYARDVGAA